MSDNLTGLFSPFLRDRRINAARPYLAGQILDYGCGVGLLCELLPQASYVGVDLDRGVLAHAKRSYPEAKFYTPAEFARQTKLKFDTVVGLAIIEHVDQPLEFLRSLVARLKEGGRIVLTTPHPALEWVLHVGGRFGLFSKASHEEHNVLLDRKLVNKLAEQAGLQVLVYRRFLLGANQLIVYQKSKPQ